MKCLWSSSVIRVAYETVCTPICEGSLGLLDLASLREAAQVKWIDRMCANDFQRWTLFPRYIFNVHVSLYNNFLQKSKIAIKGEPIFLIAPAAQRLLGVVTP